MISEIQNSISLLQEKRDILKKELEETNIEIANLFAQIGRENNETCN